MSFALSHQEQSLTGKCRELCPVSGTIKGEAFASFGFCFPYSLHNARVWKIDKRNFGVSWIYPNPEEIWLKRVRFIQIETRLD
jgi:hypothetical protein